MADQKLRIGIVLSSVPSYSETFFTTKINVLVEQGVEVFLFASGKRNPSLRCKQIRPLPVFESTVGRFCALIFLPAFFLIAPAAMRRFWTGERKESRNTIEIVKRLYLNAHLLTARLDWLHFGFATMALGRENVAWSINAKMAVSFRGYDINVYPLKFPGCYSILWEKVDKVHSISKYLLEKAYSLGLSQNKRFQIIPPAIDAMTNPKIQLTFHEPVRIITVARLSWIKGLEYGIRAVAKLKSEGLNVRYTIVGDGPDYEKLIYEIHDFGVQGDVELVGRLSHPETLERLIESDIYIQPSLNEGFCNAVLEAQAAGLLCVVSDAGGLPENVLDGISGWVVPKRDSVRLAECIMKVVSLDPQKQEEIKHAASQRAKEKFNIADHRKAWVEFYQDNSLTKH